MSHEEASQAFTTRHMPMANHRAGVFAWMLFACKAEMSYQLTLDLQPCWLAL